MIKEIVATQSPASNRPFLITLANICLSTSPPATPQHFTFINFTVRVSDGVLYRWQREVLAKILTNLFRV